VIANIGLEVLRIDAATEELTRRFVDGEIELSGVLAKGRGAATISGLMLTAGQKAVIEAERTHKCLLASARSRWPNGGIFASASLSVG
jgi:hypothetical protein